MTSGALAGQIYDAAADFSLANNPNGVWSYGYELSFGSGFQLHTTSTNDGFGVSGLKVWYSPQLSGNLTPFVGYNSNYSDSTFFDSVTFRRIKCGCIPLPHFWKRIQRTPLDSANGRIIRSICILSRRRFRLPNINRRARIAKWQFSVLWWGLCLRTCRIFLRHGFGEGWRYD